MPKAGVVRAVRRRSSAISLGFSLRSAVMLKTSATTAAPRNRKAPVMCRKSSHSYLSTWGEYDDGRDEASPASADRDDRGRQLDTRSRGGARPRRAKGGRRARGR